MGEHARLGEGVDQDQLKLREEKRGLCRKKLLRNWKYSFSFFLGWSMQSNERNYRRLYTHKVRLKKTKTFSLNQRAGV
jgi:hypothetical protein